MNWKNKTMLLILSLICTVLIAFGISRYNEMIGVDIILNLAIFVCFFLLFSSLYSIIKKKDIKLNICLVIEGMDGIILLLSAFMMGGNIIKAEILLPITIISLIIFFIISAICMKLEQNMKEKQGEESI